MTLADLRKLSIKQQYRIRFVLANGMECVVTQHGIAQVPALQGMPDFNIEQDLASVSEFLLEPSVFSDKKNAPEPRSVTREEMAALTNSAPVHVHDEHEDD